MKWFIWLAGTLFTFFMTAFIWNSLWILKPPLDNTIKIGIFYSAIFFIMYIPLLFEPKKKE